MTATRGYTLLEMVVVVGLLALATAMVAPAGYRMARSWQDADEIKQVMRSISRLPVAARQTGRALQLDKGLYDSKLPALTVPDDWQLHFAAPLTVRANGACGDSSGTLDTGTQTIDFVVEAPYCRVKRDEAMTP